MVSKSRLALEMSDDFALWRVCFCTYKSCAGPFGKRNFPRKPPNEFNYTAENLPPNLLTPSFGTEVRVLESNASVEIILQGTNVLDADKHPIHLHGYSFYVVGWGSVNFDLRILQDIILLIHLRRLQLEFLIMDGL
ncbi:hypothetical protein POTOM_058770 [Populus tomentosa]|uniref:Plastocyanin-like domain-containing protein n=1 Tax=Populus tomentosa TaxID=118781 RepID=A0A8X8C0Y8_POPTO|nr:hypothetical protein POTOM_058770 [Populus tomentosa]